MAHTSTHSTALITSTGGTTVETVSIDQWADSRIERLIDILDKQLITDTEYQRLYGMIMDEIKHPHANSPYHN